MTLQEALDGFLLSRRLAGLSERTISNYRQFVGAFVRSAGPGKPLEGTTQQDVNAYLAALLDRPLSRAARATYVRHVKVFLKWAEGEGDVRYSSRLVKVPRSPKRSVRIYSDEEVKQIFSSIRAEADWLVLRNKCILALMYDSGLRQSEACGLRERNVSLAGGLMTVRGKGGKERVVPLGRMAGRLLSEYLACRPFRSEYVFVGRRGQPLTCNAVKLFVSRLAEELPFELSSHKLRHNFATNYCLDQYRERGQVDVYRLMYLMGHEEVGTTRRYLHLANEILASQGCKSHLDGILGP